jgi:hypothetical protein
VDDVVDPLLTTPDNAVEDGLDVELAEGGNDLWEVPGERALLARLQGDALLAAVGDAAVS